MTTEWTAAQGFLRDLFSGGFGNFMFFALPGQSSQWFPVHSFDDGSGAAEVEAAFERLLPGHDLYMGCAFYGDANERKAENVIGIPGLWVDLDIADPVHKKGNYPPTLEAAADLLAATGIAPTLIIHSGHGLHAWWLFREPWMFDNEEEKARAAKLLKDWQTTIRELARADGWTVDSTHDLSRILRLPGTMNRKAQPYKTVGLIGGTGLRLNPSDFDELLIPETPAVSRKNAPGDAQAVNLTGFTISDRAVPPFDMFQALYVNSKRLRDIWEGRRGDMADGSASSYDLALANVLAAAGWGDQEIVDTCIAWRRKHGHDDPKKINRPDYWGKWVLARVRERYGYPVDELGPDRPEERQERQQPSPSTLSPAPSDTPHRTKGDTRRTERRAREAAHTEDVASETDAADEEWEAAQDAADEERMVQARRHALETASKLLGVRIDGMQRLDRDPHDYRLLVRGEVVSIGTAGKLIAQPSFRAAVVDATLQLPRLLEKQDWQAVLRLLLRACVIAPPTQEETNKGIVSVWLAEYLAQKRGLPKSNLKEAQRTEGPYYGEDRVLRIFSNDFWGYVATQPERPTRAFVADGLRTLGGKQEKVNVYVEKRRTSKQVWSIPDPPSIEWDKSESE
jgi:hypothetical protein